MQNTLEEYMLNKNIKNVEPLAYRLRAKTLDEILGQQEILGKDKLLYKMI